MEKLKLPSALADDPAVRLMNRRFHNLNVCLVALVLKLF